MEKRGATEYVLSVNFGRTAPLIEEQEMFLDETVTAKAIGKIGFPSEF